MNKQFKAIGQMITFIYSQNFYGDYYQKAREEQIEAASRRFMAHKDELKQSYGLGILMNFKEIDNLWGVETVYNGRMLYLVFNSNILSDMCVTEESSNIAKR
jgi:hypothetical protein